MQCDTDPSLTPSDSPSPRRTTRRRRRALWASCALALGLVACGTSKNFTSSTEAPARHSVLASPATVSGMDDAAVEESMAGEAAPAPEAEPGFAERKVEGEWNTESYDSITENRFVSTGTSPLSTFSIDVDTASYANVRRFLTQGTRPPPGAVRIEEMINYFSYDYPEPTGDQPFSVYTEVAAAPWAPEHRLLHIGLQGKKIPTGRLPARNLVFLLDVSGSMNEPNKLPLLKRSFAALLDTLHENDTVSMVVYAGASGVVLPPTSAHRKATIRAALDRLEAGGSTNGGEGIEVAYRLAEQHFRPEGVNRVVLATDGDFNVGTTDQSSLIRLIERKRESGIFLTVLGFGMGNYKDSTLEKLADKGNGNYAYIDDFREARKVLVEEGGANLVTIAKDVKIQVEMNPAFVGAYRLIGYENRLLRDEDFHDDTKDAGEIGAGHTVTALYELLTPEQAASALVTSPLKYQRNEIVGSGDASEVATVKLRYKPPTGRTSRLLTVPVQVTHRAASDAFQFSAAVASFGMLLRNSEYRGESSYALVDELARSSLGDDRGGYRREFLRLVNRAPSIMQ